MVSEIHVYGSYAKQEQPTCVSSREEGFSSGIPALIIKMFCFKGSHPKRREIFHVKVFSFLTI